jgi:hypothetical protein
MNKIFLAAGHQTGMMAGSTCTLAVAPQTIAQDEVHRSAHCGKRHQYLLPRSSLFLRVCESNSLAAYSVRFTPIEIS